MKRTAWFCRVAAPLACMACGCQMEPAGGGTGLAAQVGQVDRVQVTAMLMQAAFTSDKASPGPDGIQFQVYFFRMDQPRTVSVSGTMDVWLYDVPIERIQTAKPFFTKSFDNPQLSSCLGRTPFGPGYNVLLTWGERRPASKTVVLVVRYHPPAGKDVVCSDPMTIPLAAAD